VAVFAFASLALWTPHRAFRLAKEQESRQVGASLQAAPLTITIGASRFNNERCVTTSDSVTCAKDAGNRGKRLNTDHSDADDSFIIAASGDTKVCAQRTDSSGGWGMDLQISCKLSTPCRYLDTSASCPRTRCAWSNSECVPSCAGHVCSFGYEKKAGVSSLTKPSDQKCCQESKLPPLKVIQFGSWSKECGPGSSVGVERCTPGVTTALQCPNANACYPHPKTAAWTCTRCIPKKKVDPVPNYCDADKWDGCGGLATSCSTDSFIKSNCQTTCHAVVGCKLATCHDIIPEGQSKWRGMTGYQRGDPDCNWYVNTGRCFASNKTFAPRNFDDKYPMYGYSADQACCNCGGGNSVGKSL
jgi:hypothetical protein